MTALKPSAASPETIALVIDLLNKQFDARQVLFDETTEAHNSNCYSLKHYYFDQSRAKCEAHPHVVVVLPETVEQVQYVIQLANQQGVPVIPSGGRTGLSGGASVCQDGFVIVLAMDRMNHLHRVNPVTRTLRCEAGVITAQAQEAAEKSGFLLPVDFASAGSSQIGGNVATNAGGIRVVKYGMLRQWVRGLTVVTGQGHILTLNHGLKKNNTGYDLMQLFIGSEGTLGVVCDVTVELAAPPLDPVAMLLGVPSLQQALRYCRLEIHPVSFWRVKYFVSVR